MPRELRKRGSRVNYAAMVQFEDEDEEQPSAPPVQTLDAGAESGSDFAPGAKDEHAHEEDEEIDDLADDNDGSALTELSDAEQPVRPSKGPSARAKKRTLKDTATENGATSVIPSVNHRHRAIPLYERIGKSERLANEPQPFKNPTIISTNGWSVPIVETRVAKAWGYNVGPGPLWELMEDRGWFNEGAETEEAAENGRRPRVHESVLVKDGWSLLEAKDAAPYLPSGEIQCSFGPTSQQQKLHLKIFDSIDIDQFFPGSSSQVFNAGAPVWALDWCPLHADDREALSQKQYLAVGPLPSHGYEVRVGVRRERPACIQIWSIGPSHRGSAASLTNSGGAVCEMVLCIENGPAAQLKWCPLPSNDPLGAESSTSSRPRKLGLLAGTFEDGSTSIYAVAYPPDLRSGARTGPIYVKLAEPIVRIAPEETACWSLDWSNSEILAIGCTNGTVVVYNVKEILDRGAGQAIQPTHFFTPHQSAVRSVAWIRAPTVSADGETTSDPPTVLLTAGFDGVLNITDTRIPCPSELFRTRDVVSSVCFSPYSGGPISLDQSQVKAISLAPAMLTKGTVILDPDGPVWDVSSSDYHPQFACAVSDGSCLTTNTMRNPRRGGSVPFFEHKIYQMDYNRKTGEYRMLEHFLPKEVPRMIGPRGGRIPSKGIGTWPPEVGIHRATWNSGNGLANACWLASATASGLCRVDWLTGRWIQGRMPYYSVEGIRNEVEADDESD